MEERGDGIRRRGREKRKKKIKIKKEVSRNDVEGEFVRT